MRSLKAAGLRKNVVGLLLVTALRLSATAADQPETLQVAPSDQSLPAETAARGSLGASPLRQLDQPRVAVAYSQLFDPSYVLSDRPRLEVKNFTALGVTFQFDIQFAQSSWTEFAYNGRKYRSRIKVRAQHSWRKSFNAINGVTASADNTRSCDAWVSLETNVPSGESFVSLIHQWEVQKKVGNAWVKSPETFGSSIVGTVKWGTEASAPIRFSWHGLIYRLGLWETRGVEDLTVTGKMPCELHVSALIYKPKTKEVISGRFFKNDRTWEWNSKFIERELSPDTKNTLLDIRGGLVK